MIYNLEHLTQDETQDVWGPIQDDEALFLYALIRVKLIKTVFEVGGLNGYSARNFLSAIGPGGKVFTCDTMASGASTLHENHKGIHKDCRDVTPEDLENRKIDLVFFDCHVYDAQLQALERFEASGMVDDNTVIAIHDTGLHSIEEASRKRCGYFNTVVENGEEGVVHQPEDRTLVNTLTDRGWHALCLHASASRFDDSTKIKFRHGLTILSKFKQLAI